MKNKGDSLTKWLLVILGILVIVVAVLSFRQYFKDVGFLSNTLKNETPIKVGELKDDNEKAIGTIIYPGVENETVEILKNNLAQKVTFEVTDSLDGVINIYAQDLLNRYANASVARKEIKKSEALNQKATVLTCSSQTGKITVTIWSNNKGLTSVEIEKENSF